MHIHNPICQEGSKSPSRQSSNSSFVLVDDDDEDDDEDDSAGASPTPAMATEDNLFDGGDDSGADSNLFGLGLLDEDDGDDDDLFGNAVAKKPALMAKPRPRPKSGGGGGGGGGGSGGGVLFLDDTDSDGGGDGDDALMIGWGSTRPGTLSAKSAALMSVPLASDTDEDNDDEGAEGAEAPENGGFFLCGDKAAPATPALAPKPAVATKPLLPAAEERGPDGFLLTKPAPASVPAAEAQTLEPAMCTPEPELLPRASTASPIEVITVIEPASAMPLEPEREMMGSSEDESTSEEESESEEEYNVTSTGKRLDPGCREIFLVKEGGEPLGFDVAVRPAEAGDGHKGLVATVRAVKKKGLAEREGLNPGDKILQIGDMKLSSVYYKGPPPAPPPRAP